MAKLCIVTPEDIKKLQTTVADLEAQLQDTVAYQGTIVKTNLFGTETWQGPNGVYQISKKLASERAKEWGTLKALLEEAKAQLEEALALQAMIQKAEENGFNNGTAATVVAAQIVNPTILELADEVGRAAIADIEDGKLKIAAGEELVKHGEKNVRAASIFHF